MNVLERIWSISSTSSVRSGEEFRCTLMFRRCMFCLGFLLCIATAIVNFGARAM